MLACFDVFIFLGKKFSGTGKRKDKSYEPLELHPPKQMVVFHLVCPF